MKRNLTIASLLALLIAGCTSNSNSPKPIQLAPQQVVFADDLAQYVAVSPIQRSFDSNNIMTVTVPLRATTDLDLTVDYRLTWLDDSHNPIDSPSTWQTKLLRADSLDSIQAQAPSSRARDFQLDLRMTKSAG